MLSSLQRLAAVENRRARAWWRDRGPAALGCRPRGRVEQGQMLILASGDRAELPHAGRCLEPAGGGKASPGAG